MERKLITVNGNDDDFSLIFEIVTDDKGREFVLTSYLAKILDIPHKELGQCISTIFYDCFFEEMYDMKGMQDKHLKLFKMQRVDVNDDVEYGLSLQFLEVTLSILGLFRPHIQDRKNYITKIIQHSFETYKEDDELDDDEI